MAEPGSAMNSFQKKCATRVVQAAMAMLVAFGAAAQNAAPPTARAFAIEKSAPGFDELIAPDAALELLGDRYGLTEGPVWVDSDGGYLIFTDLIADVIYRWDRKQGTSVFLEHAGYSGPDIYTAGTQTIRGRMHVLLIGPNGITLDAQGRVVWCASPDGRIMRLEKDGKRTIIAEKYQGRKFNGPNDLVYRSDGTLFFTETIWGLRGVGGGRTTSPYRDLPFTGVFMVKAGEVSLLVDDKALGGMPNGLAFSPDEKFLYLNADDKHVLRYDVKADGALTNAKKFIEGEGSDGIKVDVKGNVYTTNGAGPGEVRITSPDGVRLGTLKLPILDREPRAQICATNVAFGDADGRGLYITACEHVYRVQMKVEGTRPQPRGAG
jgi:gluconolactonase